MKTDVYSLLMLKLNRRIAKGALTREVADSIISDTAKLFAINQLTDEQFEEIVIKIEENIIDED